MVEKLSIENVSVAAKNQQILANVSLDINAGETHILIGPNGSGKTTLAQVLAGNPHLSLIEGKILMDDQSILAMSPDERVKVGLFVVFQNPVDFSGINYWDYLRSICPDRFKENLSYDEFRNKVRKIISDEGIDPILLDRNFNEGFSGGEKKISELIQLLVLAPKYVVIDEVDSGLDIDRIKILKTIIKKLNRQKVGIILISHHTGLLREIDFDFVHIMSQGRIAESGGKDLIKKVEQGGYKDIPLVFGCDTCPLKND